MPTQNTKKFFAVMTGVAIGGILLTSMPEAGGIFAQVVPGETSSSSDASVGSAASASVRSAAESSADAANASSTSAAPAEDSGASSVSGIDTGGASASSAETASSTAAASSTASEEAAQPPASSSAPAGEGVSSASSVPASSQDGGGSSAASSESTSVASASGASVSEAGGASSAAAMESLRGTLIEPSMAGRLGNAWIRFSVPRAAGIVDADDLQEQLHIVLMDAGGGSIEAESSVETGAATYIVTVLPPSSFRPGAYTLRVTPRAGLIGRLFRGLFGDDREPILEETVEWGTVAVNTDRWNYVQGEEVMVATASADTDGTLRCADALAAAFAGGEEQVQEPACGNAAVTLSMPAAAAALTLRLTVGTETQTFARTIDVRGAEIDVRRTSATAVHPGDDAAMEIEVAFPEGVRGAVRETVPAGFTVSNVEPAGEVRNLGEDGTQITWDGQWEAGTRTFRYTYAAPADAPVMGLFGPLTVRGERTDPGAAAPASSVSSEAMSAEASSAAASSEAVSSEDTADAASSASPSAASSSAVAEESGAADSSAAASASASSAEGEQETSIEVPADAETIVIPVIPADAAASSGMGAQEDTPDTSSATETEPVSFWNGFTRAIASILRPSRWTASTVVDGVNLSFMEDARWQVLVARGPLASGAGDRDRTLTLERTAAVFAADAPATFRIVDTDLSSEENIVDDADRLKADVAVREVLHAVVAEEDIRAAALQDAIRTHAETIAERAAPALVDRSSGVSVRGVEHAVESALTENGAARQTLAKALADAESVRDAAAALATDAVKQEVIGRLADTIAADQDAPVAAAVIEEIVAETTNAHTDKKAAAAQAVAQTAGSDRTAAEAVREAVAKSPARAAPAPAAPLLLLELTGPDGTRIENPPFHFTEGSVQIALDPLPAFRPGLYTLTVVVTNPLSGEQETFTQQFVWGVLAVNADKDTYALNETAMLHFGVLDDLGEIVCDADLILQVTRPDGTIQILTSADQSILTTGTCGRKEAGFIQPDYLAVLPLQQEGDYTLRLTAEFAGKVRSIATELHVQPDAPFMITRKGATRLWPFAPSPMVVSVRFGTDFSGSITDKVPPGFTVGNILPFGLTFQDAEGNSYVRWEGSWKEGETATFRYYYDAPDISPYFYLIGPLEIGSDEPFSGSTPTEPSSAQ